VTSLDFLPAASRKGAFGAAISGHLPSRPHSTAA
jgi:hypothetical protein